jgi:hypothetical protein
VVGSQIANLTSDPSFGHNLCFKCPNGQCKPILDIYVLIAFQWYKKNLSIQWVFTLVIALWRFGSPSGLQFPKWKYPWECEGSFPHTFLHSQASLLARNLANPRLGREPKARVATWILCCPEVGWVSEIWGVRFLVVHPRTSLPTKIYISLNKNVQKMKKKTQN